MAALVLSATFASGQQTLGSFRCESHSVAIDRFPSAVAVSASAPEQDKSPRILDAEFSGFDARYPLKSVRFVVLFTDSGNQNLSPGLMRGTLRFLALLRGAGHEQWLELKDGKSASSPSQPWYQDWELSLSLRATVDLGHSGDSAAESDDPSVSLPGRPQIRIQQAEKGTPVFLLKYIGLTSAGGRGYVDTEEAMVVDLRSGEFSAPAAVGCVKNDFAGENHEDEWIECQWNSSRWDYVCRNNSHSDHEWSFLMIAGKKLPAKPRMGRPRR